MLLGDTLILDELDSANAYRQEVKWFFEWDWLILKRELKFPPKNHDPKNWNYQSWTSSYNRRI